MWKQLLFEKYVFICKLDRHMIFPYCPKARNLELSETIFWDFPGGPVVKTLHFYHSG